MGDGKDDLTKIAETFSLPPEEVAAVGAKIHVLFTMDPGRRLSPQERDYLRDLQEDAFSLFKALSDVPGRLGRVWIDDRQAAMQALLDMIRDIDCELEQRPAVTRGNEKVDYLLPGVVEARELWRRSRPDSSSAVYYREKPAGSKKGIPTTPGNDHTRFQARLIALATDLDPSRIRSLLENHLRPITVNGGYRADPDQGEG